jgi:hypothetical protein
VEGAEVVIEPTLAVRQLCAASRDAGAVGWVTPAVGGATVGRTPEGRDGRNETVRCSEGQLYRCSGRDVVSCRENAIIGTCVRGCFAPDAFLDEGIPMNREAAFAIFCSR